MVREQEKNPESVDFSRIRSLSEVFEPDVSVDYIQAMFRVIGKFKYIDDSQRLIREVCTGIYESHFNTKIIQFEQFEKRLNSPENFINILVYHLFAEKTRMALDLSPEEFYDAVGFFGVINDPVFQENVNRRSVADILWGLSVFNRGKNHVTDVREMATSKTKENGEIFRTSLVERVTEPHSLERILAHFSLSDANRLLAYEFMATQGAYNATAKAKETTCEITIVHPNYKMESPEKMLALKKFIATKALRIRPKMPFMENDTYKNDPRYARNSLGFDIPPYMRYLVGYSVTEEKKRTKDKKRSWADQMEVGFIHNLRSLDLQRQTVEEMRKRAEEAEKYARHLQAQQDGFGHDVGNGITILEISADNLMKRCQSAMGLIPGTGKAELAQEDYNSLRQGLESLLNLAGSLRMSTDASRTLLAGRISQIKADCTTFDIADAVKSYAKDYIETYNLKVLRSRETSLDRNNSSQPIEYIFESADDGRLYVHSHEGLLRMCLNNALKNATKALESSQDPRIKIKILPDRLEETISLIISDNGQGADPETVRKINSGEEIATGQGINRGMMSIKKCMEITGGRMKAESSPGRGFNLYLTLPIGQEATGPEQSEEYYIP